MNDQYERLSDDVIEQGLARRAPHGPDAALLQSILFAAAQTPQVRSWRPSNLSRDPVPIRLAWVAIVMALLLAVAALIIGGGRPRPREMAITVDPSVSLRPSPPMLATSDSEADPCVGEPIDVLTGAALPSMTDTLVGLDHGRGVYVGDAGDLWAVASGRGPATRIAKFTAEPSVLDVLDLSPDGSAALIRAGHIARDARVRPGCADLYLVRTDGSSATRLTALQAPRFVAGAAFAPDGVRVAYSAWDPGTLTIIDAVTPLTMDLPCEGGPVGDPLSVSWSPGGDHVVAHCGPNLAIVDPSGAIAPIVIPPNDAPLPFIWTDDTHLLIVRGPSGEHRGRLSFESFDVISQTSTVIGRMDPPGFQIVDSPSGGFSPDGRWLAFLGWDPTLEAAVGYLVPTTGGAPTRILRPNQVTLPLSWSADSRALVYIDMIGSPTMHLGQLEVDTLQQSFIGRLPGGRYLKGIWQIP